VSVLVGSKGRGRSKEGGTDAKGRHTHRGLFQDDYIARDSLERLFLIERERDSQGALGAKGNVMNRSSKRRNK